MLPYWSTLMQVISLLTVSRLFTEFLWQSYDCSRAIFPVSTLLRCYKIYWICQVGLNSSMKWDAYQFRLMTEILITRFQKIILFFITSWYNISYLAINLLINFGSTLVTVFCFLLHVFKNFPSLCNVFKKSNNK